VNNFLSVSRESVELLLKWLKMIFLKDVKHTVFQWNIIIISLSNTLTQNRWHQNGFAVEHDSKLRKLSNRWTYTSERWLDFTSHCVSSKFLAGELMIKWGLFHRATRWWVYRPSGLDSPDQGRNLLIPLGWRKVWMKRKDDKGGLLEFWRNRSP